MQNAESRMHSSAGAEYRMQNAESTHPTYSFHTFCGILYVFCMLRQNTESAPDDPTYSFHAFCRILYVAAEYRIRAGSSNIQFPRLLRDSVCCGRIQNPRRTIQHTVSTPFAGFCMLRQNTESAPGRPTYSFHAFCGILYAAAEYRMRGAECRILDFSRIQEFKVRGRIQNTDQQILFPLPQPPLTLGSAFLARRAH